MIETIFEDIEELEQAIKRPERYVRLRNVVDQAIQSLSWLLDDCDYDPHGLTFHDICEYAGCTKPEIVRKGVISRLHISKEAAAVLAQCV